MANKPKKTEKKPGKNGGKRPNAGRKPGGKNTVPQEKRDAIRKYKERIRKRADRLLNAQMTLAEGCSHLVRVNIGNNGARKSEIVTDLETIIKFFDGELENETNIKYHYITTEKPDRAAIKDMLDRAFGKPVQPIGGTGGGDEDDDEPGSPIKVVITNYGNSPSSQVRSKTVSNTRSKGD